MKFCAIEQKIHEKASLFVQETDVFYASVIYTKAGGNHCELSRFLCCLESHERPAVHVWGPDIAVYSGLIDRV